jgi:hypothetical protein
VDDAPTDDRLLDQMRATAEAHDDVPPGVFDAARAAYTWRTIDAELAALATLTFDSDSTDKELAGVRGTLEARLLSFEGTGGALDVELTVDAEGGVRIAGQVLTVPDATVHVDDPSGTVDAVADADGRFDVRVTTGGPVRLRVVGGGETVVRTEWISL